MGEALEGAKFSMTNPVMQQFLETQEAARDAEAEQDDLVLEEALRSLQPRPEGAELLDSLPEALERFGIEVRPESEYQQDQMRRIAEHLDGKMESLTELVHHLGRMVAGAKSRGYGGGFRGLDQYLSHLGRFER